MILCTQITNGKFIHDDVCHKLCNNNNKNNNNTSKYVNTLYVPRTLHNRSYCNKFIYLIFVSFLHYRIQLP